MASDDGSDYGWDLDLDGDAHALLNAVAEATATAIDQSATTTVATSLASIEPIAPLALTASTPTPTPTLVAAPNDALRDDVLSPGQTAAEIGAGADADADEVVLGTEGAVRIQDLQNTLGTGHPRRLAGTPVAYPDLSRGLNSLGDGPPSTSTAAAAGQTDARSPLARFRSFPRKPLSVSDLTAGAWCEVQYEYTLTRLPGGRPTRTAAMKGGTRVHARLEEEVHTTVRVDVSTREDFVGIKLWNMIQGLRTLRETGLTRELEIWGVVPGTGGEDGEDVDVDGDGAPQVVNGVIDALSYHNPDPAFEELLASTGSGGLSPEPAQPAGSPTTPRKRGRPKSKTNTPTKTKTPTKTPTKTKTPTASPQTARITDFFASQSWPRSSGAASGQNREGAGEASGQAGETAPPPSAAPPPPPRIYITDIKTRSTDRLPTGVAMRPTKVQLFLYHRFLCDLAAGRLDFDIVFRRQRLHQDTPFSDAFLAQIGALHEVVHFDADNETYEIRDVVDPDHETVRHRTLRALVELLKEEVGRTFPRGADSVGSLVAVEYRMRARARPRREVHDNDEDNDEEDDEDYDPDAGRCIGTNVIPVDEGLLERYLSWYMAWWRGQRPAVGVQVEEVGYKCRLCEFGDDCAWRIGKAEEHMQRVRERRVGG